VAPPPFDTLSVVPAAAAHRPAPTRTRTEPVDRYLDGIRHYAVLTHEQETGLAKRIEAGLYAEHLLAVDPRAADPQHSSDLRTVAREGRLAKHALLEANLRLVAAIARRYAGRGVPLLDLIQEGNLGLIHAVEKYDYTPGFRFATYASWWIHKHVARALVEQGRTIRVPAQVTEQLNRVARTTRDLAARLGRQPRHEETAAALGVSGYQLAELLSYAQAPLSLDQVFGAGGVSVPDRLRCPDPVDTAGESARSAAVRREIDGALADLTVRERAVVRLRYGLDDGRHRTLVEVGRELGVTRERVRQLERRVLTKLHARSERLRALAHAR
jgi:RNA polymerase primary sigma factor/RNA polymerase nonessential primary-like sigma factor